MKFLAIATAAASLLSTTSAATIAQRDVIASFIMSPENGCTKDVLPVEIPVGQACGACTAIPRSPFSSDKNTPYQTSISLTKLDPRCRVTVYDTSDCSSAGIVSGLGGCWSPEGKIYAYKVDCPWYPFDANPMACSTDPGCPH